MLVLLLFTKGTKWLNQNELSSGTIIQRFVLKQVEVSNANGLSCDVKDK